MSSPRRPGEASQAGRTRRPLPEDRRDLLAMSAARGLADAEAAERRARFGPNDILERRERPWRELAADTARDPMLWFLVGTGALYAALGERVEALILLASVIPLVAMDALLHRRTRASTRGLRAHLATTATAVRDGRARELPASELVPGDLARVGPGEAFPADGLIVAGDGLQADESALTGESLPVRKRPLGTEPLPSLHAPVLALDVAHWAFAGTRLLTGRADLRVALTGGETLYGEIVRSASLGGRARTPLQRSVDGLVRALLTVALLLCAALAWVRWHQGFGWADAVVSAVTLAVAALPEEFPVVLVMFLGVGVYRLARQRALVRRSVSVENVGRVTCIASDKTGTLTLGALRLAHILPGREATEEGVVRLAALAARLDTGDPLDDALLAAAGKRSPLALDAVATFPFTEDRRRETAVWRREGGGLVIATKGAPEAVLATCHLAPEEHAAWSGRVASLAAEGHKVLACASREVAEGGWAGGEPDRDLRLAGLLAFEDPVRAGVAASLAQCREAGIRVVMVTGDHPSTAAAIAREIGLGGAAPRCVTGEELEARLAGGGRDALDGIDVVARALPAQKLALVRALQRAGEIVAVTGDGVNDVPALQVADVGIAMGERGTRSAREAAAIVLLDDDFRTIVGAIAEGRQLFRNLQDAFRYLLSIHIPLVVTAALIPLAGYPLVYLPIHIVWLELVIHPSALLAFQAPAAPGRLVPDERGAGFFSTGEWVRIAIVGGLLTALLLAGYGLHLADGAGHARAMALAVLSCASATLVALLGAGRTRAAAWLPWLTVAVAVAAIQTPLAARLHVAPLDAVDWGAAALGALAASLPFARFPRVRAGRRPRGGCAGAARRRSAPGSPRRPG